ncbi:hypothetical protein [Sanguibacter suaedae]|uniref:Uncharacterized protein n=1 Tax=Sanguibacter suaedae TaxID=2795737 RepID=A0A934M9V8_9MICO|nr:hypothetical protein [Sanguibacter suaedae]MBI9114985.1 hypothetical protein [Sanguibacter suaedae]
MKAKLDDGRIVHLNEDGTWSFVDGSGQALITSEHGFRRAKWGQSKSDVLRIEDSEPTLHKSDALGYLGKIATFDCFIFYTFVDDRLANGRYALREEHSNLNFHLSDYETLETLLTKKYGPCTEQQEFWSDDLYRDDYSQWGQAVAYGHYLKLTRWSGPETEVKLGISGDNFEVHVYIDYFATALEDVLHSKRQDRYLEDL